MHAANNEISGNNQQIHMLRCICEMKQLDAEMSPLTFIWIPYMTLANVTFDLDPCNLSDAVSYEFWSNDFLSVLNFGPVTNGQTYRK